ncbi:protein DpdJ [Nonomuraea sp. NPDC049625]|uniref:protein DpdJ n=1 Tax=Nonomuraea sp. NPDC049625 TaxID=3155775 RepID=UPI003442D0A6
MTSTHIRVFYGYLLNKLEDRELPLLSWGVTDNALSEDEVLEAIVESLDHPDAPSLGEDDILEDLLDRALVFRVPGEVPPRYRTRFAEGLRLTSQLRQLFAPQGSVEDQPPNWWSRGARLVADYRLHVAPRRYPKRDITFANALTELQQLPQWDVLHGKVAASVVGLRKLSEFQVTAAKAVLSALALPRSSGVIVGAGTGSGKTLSFYLPAFAAMAAHVRSGASGVHTLAIYPRIELLRDQLREALSGIDAIDRVVGRVGKRGLRVGALYGGTPSTPSELDGNGKRVKAWVRRTGGFVCPFLTCPQCPAGDLLWQDTDRNSESERLVCMSCRSEIPSGRLALTRQSLQQNPPDLLFTTTEMLNRNSTNPNLGRILGWIGNQKPSLVLLDEVHTYSGLHGAQIALLLRRWQHAVGKRVTFVGLSATLKDAPRFFSELTGVRSDAIQYIEPNPLHLEDEGREYAIALRGDPVSGASLLSTSIQTAMLFGRVLDPPGTSLANDDESLYGSTGFLFTDDLDVTNRFYDNLRHAEGLSGGRERSVLAGLRSRELPHRLDRFRDGQSWDLADKIGHYLDPDLRTGSLQIGRTSSQDAGMDFKANLIVATASLEVGFNDPRVGLVLQHKSPHDAAAFLQRKGRAGRDRGTRPITVVTLSDYGRDRLSYQGYESLFAPTFEARNLPIRNRFVLKIQASQALMDWLSRNRPSKHRWQDVRTLLTRPYNDGSNWSAANEAGRLWLADQLEKLLTSSDRQDRLARHLQAALQISPDEALAVLWEQPRSLLLAVVPTALRHLRSNWQPLREDPGALPGSLLPQFITKALFEPLNVPEVEFTLPFDSDEDESLPIAKALREAVPGRVSRRYGYQHSSHRTWLPIPDDNSSIELSSLVSLSQEEGVWHPHGHGSAGMVVLRPYQITLHRPDSDIEDRSTASPKWASQIVVAENNPPHAAEIPTPSLWSKRISNVGFCTHAAGNPIEVRRLTYGVEGEIAKNRPISKRRFHVRYHHNGRPAAMGFRLLVDAMSIEVNPLDINDTNVKEFLQSPQWRSKAFFRAVAEDPALSEIANYFQRNWLALVYITAFSLAALDSPRDPNQVHMSLGGGAWRDDLSTIFNVLYRDDNAADSQATSRLIAALSELSHEQRVVEALNRAGELLFTADVASRTASLAQRSYRDTFAAAVLAAALKACPDAQERDLIVDVVPSPDPHLPDTVWLGETSIGGLGIVEQLVHFYSADPRRFWSLVAGALRPNEYEYTDSTVTRLLQDIVVDHPHGPAAVAMARIRQATSARDADHALRELLKAWGELDGPPRHSAVATLSTRLLRPGSSKETDTTCLKLLDAWTTLEQRLGFEVDARVVAYAAGSGKLSGGQITVKADQAFSMLWPRGAQARDQHLEHYQPYIDVDRPMVLDRLLISMAHNDRLPRIDVTQSGWESLYQVALSENGAADLVCPVTARPKLAAALAHVPALPIDRGFLRIYGELVSVVRDGSQFIARVELQEAEQ